MNAFKKLDDLDKADKNKKEKNKYTLKLSDNLYVEKDTSLEPGASNDATALDSKTAGKVELVSYIIPVATTRYWTLTSSYYVNNIFGAHVVYFTGYGYFTTNGVSSIPTGTDYSYSTWPGWEFTSIWTSRSVTATNNAYAWVKFVISSKFFVGIAPVGMTIQTKSNTLILYMNQNGSYYSQLL